MHKQTQPDPIEPPLLNTSFVCTKCQLGYMLPAIEEGEPDYTEHYTCHKCQHHDIIPTLVTIISQLGSGFLGIFICAYLASDHSSVLSSFYAELEQDKPALNTLMAILTLIFAFSFGYVIIQAVKGYMHRRAYQSCQMLNHG